MLKIILGFYQNARVKVLLCNLEGSYIKLNSHFAKPIKVMIRGANKRHHRIINFVLYSNT